MHPQFGCRGVDIGLRDTPGGRRCRTLTALRDIETEHLSAADAHRIEIVTMLLPEVSVPSEVGHCGGSDD